MANKKNVLLIVPDVYQDYNEFPLGLAYLVAMREKNKSLLNISKGTVITEDMVWVKRPGIGIPAKYLESVIGMKTQKNIKANTIIKWSDLG